MFVYVFDSIYIGRKILKSIKYYKLYNINMYSIRESILYAVENSMLYHENS